MTKINMHKTFNTWNHAHCVLAPILPNPMSGEQLRTQDGRRMIPGHPPKGGKCFLLDGRSPLAIVTRAQMPGSLPQTTSAVYRARTTDMELAKVASDGLTIALRGVRTGSFYSMKAIDSESGFSGGVCACCLGAIELKPNMAKWSKPGGSNPGFLVPSARSRRSTPTSQAPPYHLRAMLCTRGWWKKPATSEALTLK